MAKQRILLITARSDIGGGPLYTVDFARSAGDQYEVAIASPLDPPHGPTLKQIAWKHIEIPHRRFSLGKLFELARFVRDNQISIIHSHGRGAGMYSRLLRSTGAKIVHTYHGIHRDPSLVGQVKFWIDRVLQYFTDDFIFVSMSEYQDASRAGFKMPAQPKIIYPLAPPCWTDAPTQFHQPIRIGGLSRIDYQKGIDLLFEGLARFRQKYPQLNWTFELAGGAPNAEVKIPTVIADRARWIGPTDDPIQFLRSLDVYVAHSRWESFNITVIEALAQGLPPLISNVPGHEYFIQEGVAQGFELGDFDGFATKLEHLITSSKPAPNYPWIEKNHRKMDIHY